MNYRLPLDNPAQPDPHEARKDALVDAAIEKHRQESENKMSKKTEQEYQAEAEAVARATGEAWIFCPEHDPQTLPQIILKTIPIAALLKARDERDSLRASLQICVGAAGIGDASELCGWIDNAIKARDERDELKRQLADAKLPTVEHVQDIYELTKLRADNAALMDVAREARKQPTHSVNMVIALTALKQKGISIE